MTGNTTTAADKVMANLKETPEWIAGIYQLETADPVLGGADGIANRQARELGSRTQWLKEQSQIQEVAFIRLATVQINTLHRQIRQEYRLLALESRSARCR